MNRIGKLKELQKNNRDAGVNLIAVTGPFLQAFEEKIDSFKKILDVPVEVDAYELIEAIKDIKLFAPHVKELVDSIYALEVPEMPKSIDINGLQEAVLKIEELNETQSKQLEQLQKIKDIKLPDFSVQLKVLGEKEVSKITKKLDDVLNKNNVFDKSADLVFKNITNAIEKLVEVIAANSVSKEQTPDAYTPFRRVRAIGNKFIFDDDAWGGSAGGGGVQELGSSSIATAQLTIADSPTLIIAQRNGRRGVLVTNLSSVDIWIGDETVTTSTGSLLLGTRGTALFIPSQTAIYGVVASGSETISYLEAY